MACLGVVNHHDRARFHIHLLSDGDPPDDERVTAAMLAIGLATSAACRITSLPPPSSDR
jgi:hypothetical protein